MPVCLCSYRGVSEQEQCKKLHLPHSQLTAEAPSKVLPVVMVSATPRAAFSPSPMSTHHWDGSAPQTTSGATAGALTALFRRGESLRHHRTGGQPVLCSPDRNSSSKVWPDFEAKSSEDHPEQLSGIFQDLPLSHLQGQGLELRLPPGTNSPSSCWMRCLHLFWVSHNSCPAFSPAAHSLTHSRYLTPAGQSKDN